MESAVPVNIRYICDATPVSLETSYSVVNKGESFGLNNSGGFATGKSTDAMQNADFADLLGEGWAWNADSNDGYPVLLWEEE